MAEGRGNGVCGAARARGVGGEREAGRARERHTGESGAERSRGSCACAEAGPVETEADRDAIMAMGPPPSPGPNRSRGPPPSPLPARGLAEPQSPNPNSGAASAPSPMSRLATPPRFALPSVEAGQNDRELVYTTDPTCAVRSPFMPQLADFSALSDASPAPALSPMHATATLPGGNTAVDPKVLSGA